MRRNFGTIVLLILLIFAGYFIVKKSDFLRLWGGEEAQTTHYIVLEKMQTLGQVELAKFTFRDIVEQEISRDYLPNPKALLIVQGEAVGCIDLRKITAGSLVDKGDTLIIRMPEPELCSYKIDHAKSKIHSTEYAFMNEELLLDEAYRRAEEQIRETALESGILEQTKKNADLVLKPFFENLTRRPVSLQYGLSATLSRPR